ncbi:MAG: M18 family aminopeptidase [Myxococcota bacterium]
MADPLIQRFLDYLDASPTPDHAVHQTATILEEHGFTKTSLGDRPSTLPVGHKGYVAKGGSLFAFRVGTEPAVDAGFRIIAAHTDSPNLRLKPHAWHEKAGYVRLGVEVYGGVQVATWADRDLGIAGAVQIRDASAPTGLRSQLLTVRRPVARVPTLAIHLNREVNTKGLKFNAETELPAVIGLKGERGDDPFKAWLSSELDVDPDGILGFDLSLFDLTKPALGGLDEEFVFSARLDNLGSSHAALEALLASLDSPTPAHTSVIALFDHEEVGSVSARGANSRSIEQLLGLVLRDAEVQGPGDLSRALAHSRLISADMAHAVHPGFTDRHDAHHAPALNAGPVIKQNVSHRYTTEGVSTAELALICERADVTPQVFVNRADLRCGSTVGPMLAARLGVTAIDVGNPMLSMHSAREQAGTHDHAPMVRLMQHFFV